MQQVYSKLDKIRGQLKKTESELQGTLDHAKQKIRAYVSQDVSRAKTDPDAKGRIAAYEADLKKLEPVEKSFHDTVGGLRKQIDDKNDEIRKSARQVGKNGVDSVEGVKKVVNDLLEPLVESSTKSVQGAKAKYQTAEDSVRKTLKDFEDTVVKFDDGLRTPIRKLLTDIENADNEIKKIIDTTKTILKELQKTGRQTIDGMVYKAKAMINQAVMTINTIKEAIEQFSAKTKAPLAELPATITKLKTMAGEFTTGMQTIHDKAHALMDAVPADELPKPLVKTSLSLIDEGVTQMTNTIQTALNQATAQLQNVAGQIIMSFDTVKQTAMNSIGQFREGMRKQLEAILPPLVQSLEEINKAIQAAVKSLMDAIDKAKQPAVDAINKIKEGIRAAVTAFENQFDPALKSMNDTVKTTSDSVNDQIHAAREALQASVKPIQDAIDSAIKQAQDKADAAEQSAQKTITDFENRMAEGVDVFAKPIAASLTTLRQTVRKAVDDALASCDAVANEGRDMAAAGGPQARAEQLAKKEAHRQQQGMQARRGNPDKHSAGGILQKGMNDAVDGAIKDAIDKI